LLSAYNGDQTATVEICDGSATIELTHEDEIVVTCGSAILKAVNGEVEAVLVADDGSVAEVTISGNATDHEVNILEFDPETFTFTAGEDNSEPIVVVVDGVEMPIGPGTEVMSAGINIRPFGRRNIIPLWHWGHVPVAIFSTPEFSAPDDVDQTSIRFGRSGDEDSLSFCRRRNRDVNHDGLEDLTCIFRTRDTNFEPGDTVGILKCETLDDTQIQGSDAVRVIGW